MTTKTHQLPPIRVTENQYNLLLNQVPEDKKLSEYMRDKLLSDNISNSNATAPYEFLLSMIQKYKKQRQETNDIGLSVQLGTKINLLQEIMIDIKDN